MEIRLKWWFDILVPPDAPPTNLMVLNDVPVLHDIEHLGFRYHNIGKLGSTNGNISTFMFTMTEIPVAHYATEIWVAMSCVHADGLYEESPVVPVSVVSTAESILAQTNPDAGQLRLARKVMELVGGETSTPKLTVPSLSAPMLHPEPASGDTSVAFPL